MEVREGFWGLTERVRASNKETFHTQLKLKSCNALIIGGIVGCAAFIFNQSLNAKNWKSLTTKSVVLLGISTLTFLIGIYSRITHATAPIIDKKSKNDSLAPKSSTILTNAEQFKSQGNYHVNLASGSMEKDFIISHLRQAEQCYRQADEISKDELQRTLEIIEILKAPCKIGYIWPKFMSCCSGRGIPFNILHPKFVETIRDLNAISTLCHPGDEEKINNEMAKLLEALMT